MILARDADSSSRKGTKGAKKDRSNKKVPDTFWDVTG